MRTFNLKIRESKEVFYDLSLEELKRMAGGGEITREDEIREDGHTTWHKAATVKGLLDEQS